MTKSPETWSKSKSFWGTIGTTVALTLIVVAVLIGDLHWLLMIAWLSTCVAVWSLVGSVFATRGEVWLATIMGSLIMGVALLYLHSFMKPDGYLRPTGEEARLEIRNSLV